MEKDNIESENIKDSSDEDDDEELFGTKKTPLSKTSKESYDGKKPTKKDDKEKSVFSKKPPHEDTADSDLKEIIPEQDKETDLSDQDIQDATIALVDYCGEEVLDQLDQVGEDTEQEFEILADAVFLESLRERVVAEEQFTETVIDEAFSEATEDLSIDIEDLPTTENQPTQNTGINEYVEHLSEDNFQEAGVEIELPVEPDSAPTYGSAGISHQPTHSSSIDSNNIQLPLKSKDSVSLRNPVNVLSSRQNTIPKSIDKIVSLKREKSSRNLIVDNISRDIIDRRKEQEPTDIKLASEIKILEIQVGALHDVITKKEQEIRNLAKKTVKKNPVDINKAVLAFESRKRNLEKKEEVEGVEELSKNSEKIEKIGKFSLPALEIFKDRRLITDEKSTEKRKTVEQMTVTDLLKYADTIIIGNLSIKQYFERKRLNEKSLREIVKKSLRGEEYEKIFQQELLPDIHKKENSQEKQLDKLEKRQYPPESSSGMSEPSKGLDKENIISVLGGGTSLEKEHTTSKNTSVKPNKKQVSGGVIVVIVVVIILLVLALVLTT